MSSSGAATLEHNRLSQRFKPTSSARPARRVGSTPPPSDPARSSTASACNSCAHSRQLLQLKVAILHLAAVGFEADGAGPGNFERGLQHLAVAGAMRDVVRHRHLDLIPILRLVLLELLVRTGDEVIAALQLRFADENAAVRV